MTRHYQVSQEKADELREVLEEKIPDLNISYKDEGAPTFLIAILYYFIKSLGVSGRILKKIPTILGKPFRWLGKELLSFEETFFTRVSNALFGKYLIYPSRKTHGNLRNLHVYLVTRHELVHLLDQKKQPWYFNLTYVLCPLPFVISGKSHWEFRGYAQNMIVLFEEFGEIQDDYIERMSRYFWAPLYLWMFPFKKTVRKKFKELAEKIEQGEVKGMNPDIKFFGSIVENKN